MSEIYEKRHTNHQGDKEGSDRFSGRKFRTRGTRSWRRGCGQFLRSGNGFDAGADFVGGLGAAVGLFFEGLEDDVVEAGVGAGFFGRSGEAAEGKFAGEHFVEDDAEGINVGAVVDGVWFFDLFGRHVVRCAEGGPGAGEWIFGDGFSEEFGDAEVGDFNAAAGVEEDVVGFDVAMEDAFVVGVLEGFADARDDGEGLGGVDGAGAHGLAEVDAVDVFHEEVEEGAGLAEVVDGDDVWVVEFGEGAAFAGEAFGEGGLFGEGLGEDFEGDEAIEFWLAGFVDETHAALADKFEDLEMGEGAGEFVAIGRGRAGVAGGGAGFGGEGGLLEKALGAEALGSFGRDGGAAFGTLRGRRVC